ncbi:MAG: SGNH/GDSL hydrolase family protein [Candidatus Melainabacteria bacterium]|nr:SGNH/GDSL hydrolase family protein [Candidatus Melainabacteria bacterium]
MKKDDKLTEIMFKSLSKDPSLANFDEWEKAGDWAIEIRFFPHALSCYQMAADLNKTEAVLNKINDIVDKITNVLEFVPELLKAPLEEIRLSNPLDPSKWLAISNSLLTEATKSMTAGKEPSANLIEASRFALGFGAYCASRSGNEIEPINGLLKDLIDPVDMRNWQSPKLDITQLAKDKEQIKIVALGDNVTLGLNSNWGINFQETYHYLWSQKIGHKVSLANNAISGAGVLDLVLYLGRDAIYFKPDVAILNFGINDAWLGSSILPAYEALLESSVKTLQAHSVQVVIITPLPHIVSACPLDQRPNDIADTEMDTEAFTLACKRVAMRTGAVLADAYSKFPVNETERKKYLENGFNQPNLAGQKLIQAALDEVCV